MTISEYSQVFKIIITDWLIQKRQNWFICTFTFINNLNTEKNGLDWFWYRLTLLSKHFNLLIAH